MDTIAFRKALLALSKELTGAEAREICVYTSLPSAQRTDKVRDVA